MKAVTKVLIAASVLLITSGAGYLAWKWRWQDAADVVQIDVEAEASEVFPDDTTILPAGELPTRIADYNAVQLAACGNTESIRECQGASQLELVEDPYSNGYRGSPYLFLQKRTIETAHCCDMGIDGGVDAFTTYVFKKGEALEKIVELEGDAYPLAGDKVLLSIGVSDSCAGRMQDGTIRLFSVAKGANVFEHELANGFHIVALEDRSDPDVDVRFTAHTEESVQTDPDTPGNPVDHLTRILDLHCDSTGEHCSVTKVSEERERGEQNVGGCD